MWQNLVRQSSNMKIFIGADHAGFTLKQKLIPHLERFGFEVVDKGPDHYDEEDDYPDFVIPVAKAVSTDPESCGIVIGGTGQGEAMCANRFPHVRAAVYYGGDAKLLELSREHNDANILSIGARFVDEHLIFLAVEGWLRTAFSDDARHVRRLKKFDTL